MNTTAGPAWDAFERMLRNSEADAGSAAAEFVAAVPHSDRARHIDELAVFLERATAAKREADHLMRQVTQALAALTPEVEGQHQLDGENYEVVVKRETTLEWDQSQLASMFTTGAMPAYIDLRMSVSKRMWSKLPPSEQAELLPALTTKLGRPKITVTRKP